MGHDSHTFEQSFWIRNQITALLIRACICDIYPEGVGCLRCEGLQQASRLFPVQHQQALSTWEVTRGLQS
jgi:hypothetical protein